MCIITVAACLLQGESTEKNKLIKHTEERNRTYVIGSCKIYHWDWDPVAYA